MLAEIVTIGDEILIGQIVDSNSAYISKELNKIGISVYQITSVQDDREHILKALQEAEENADIIIMTGGLGPTKDDITKTTLAEYFNDTLIQDASVLKNIEHIWEKYIKKPLQQMNIDQALVPSKAAVLMNYYGSAPGMWFQKGNKVFVSLPGVPYEMKALIKNEVIPRLRETFDLPFIMHKTLMTYGLGESMIAARINDWEEALPPFIKLAYLPSLGRVRLRLSAKGEDRQLIEGEMQRQINLLLPQIEDIFTGYENEKSLEEQIGALLVERDQSLSVAESCTGGKLAEHFTSHAGASRYFKGGIISYATDIKTSVLRVSSETIMKNSVVSEEVALEMALNAQRIFSSDYAISTTGNAGPEKGDSDAEVGTVCIGIAYPGGTKVETFEFGNHRTKVIQKAVNKSLEMIYQLILKND